MWAGITVAGASVFAFLVYLLFNRSRWDKVAANDKNIESMGRVDDGNEWLATVPTNAPTRSEIPTNKPSRSTRSTGMSAFSQMTPAS